MIVAIATATAIAIHDRRCRRRHPLLPSMIVAATAIRPVSLPPPSSIVSATIRHPSMILATVLIHDPGQLPNP
jgi:hypothetical protein